MGRDDEDADDVSRVLAGDLAAFEGFVRRWQSRLVGLAWRFCRDRATAEDMAQDASGLEQGVEDGQRAEAVRRAVLTLPTRYRDPIIVFCFHDQDVVESARSLGLPEGTLKARLRRGRELLKRRCLALGVTLVSRLPRLFVRS